MRVGLAGIYITSLCLLTGASFASYTLTLSAALYQTLQHNPSIKLQKQTVYSKQGLLQKEQGAFDPSFTTSANYEHTESPLLASQDTLYGLTINRQTDYGYDAAVSETFENGIIVAPSLTLTHAESTIRNVTGVEPQNNADLSFKVTIPFLKGRDASYDLRAAQFTYQSSKDKLVYEMSKNALGTILAYWDCKVASENLEIYKDSEARAEQLLINTKKLIAADEMPAANLKLVSANYYSKKASRINAEESLIAAKEALASSIGINALSDSQLPNAISSFPPVDKEKITKYANVSHYISYSLTHRQDLLAQENTVAANKLKLEKASNDKKDTLNLDVTAGYASLHEGEKVYQALDEKDLSGPKAGAEITYKFYFGNNATTGALKDTIAQLEKSKIDLWDLIREMRLDIMLSSSGLQTSVSQLEASLLSVDDYDATVKNETKKANLGVSTLIDVINTENDLRNAELSRISNQADYSKFLAKFAFNSGFLITPDQGVYSVSIKSIM